MKLSLKNESDVGMFQSQWESLNMLEGENTANSINE